MNDAIDRLNATIGPEALSTLLLLWVPSIIAFLLTVALFFTINAGTRRVLTRIFERTKLEKTVATFILTVTQFAITIMGG